MAVRLNPYFVMDGNAREAVEFYAKALQATVVNVTTFGETPADPSYPMPEEMKNRVMHALLKIGETDLMFSDTYPGLDFQVGNNINIALVSDNVDLTRQFFEALAAGGKVTMPLQQTFWSPLYGQVTDKFGVTWQVTTEVKG